MLIYSVTEQASQSLGGHVMCLTPGDTEAPHKARSPFKLQIYKKIR